MRYHPGEFYKPHHDYYNACETWMNGNRHFTFLIYLNDVDEGGETGFPRLNISVTPTAYSALVFNDVLDNGEPDERTLHAGEPTGHEKWIAQLWLHERPYKPNVPKGSSHEEASPLIGAFAAAHGLTVVV